MVNWYLNNRIGERNQGKEGRAEGLPLDGVQLLLIAVEPPHDALDDHVCKGPEGVAGEEWVRVWAVGVPTVGQADLDTGLRVKEEEAHTILLGYFSGNL